MGRIGSLLVLSLAASSSCLAAETRSSEARPRGVGPEFAKFYKDPDTFSCISLPSIKVPVSAVNDDYCDCPDGSDEPGTSACSHLSYLSPESPFNFPVAGEPQNLSTPALPGFYCKNKGHVPAYIPFLSVNDGKCDYDYCCDGGDEWAGVGSVSCPDRCKEIGKEYRKKDEARKKSLAVAVKRRKELVQEAAKLKDEIQQKIVSLEREIKDGEADVARKEIEVEELEKKEKLRIIKSGGKGSKTSTLAALAKGRVDELRNSLIQVRTQRDAQRARVRELEALLATFKEEYNPNFNDEGVKRAVRAWEDYAAKEKEGEWEPAHDRDLDEITKEDSESQGINWAEWDQDDTQSDEDDDVAALYNLRNYLPPSLREFLADKLSSLRTFLVLNGILAPSTTDPSSPDAPIPESPALSAARSALTNARSSVNQAQSNLRTTESDLAKSYGPDSIFRALKDKCVSTESGEYVYTHCFLSKLTQKPRKGGSETNMGNFVDVTTIPASAVDASLDPDDLSAGPSTGPGSVSSSSSSSSSSPDRVVLNYANGQGCWNGPSRSSKVVLGCSEKEVIWRVRESEKCVYEVWVGTSAVCPDSAANRQGGGGGGKDEL